MGGALPRPFLELQSSLLSVVSLMSLLPLLSLSLVAWHAQCLVRRLVGELAGWLAGMSDYVGFLDVLAPSLWSPSFRKGPASYRICEINISNPTGPTAYNPSILDREFWTPILQSYVRVRCSPSQKERLVQEYYRDLLLEMKASWWPLLPVWGSSHIRRIWTYTHKRHKILQ